MLAHDVMGEMVLAERFISPCKHHTHTVFEAVTRISRVLAFVKDTNLVHQVVYPNVSHIKVTTSNLFHHLGCHINMPSMALWDSLAGTSSA